MKTNFLKFAATLIFLFSALYVVRIFDLSYESHHPSLNDQAMKPDLLLNNVKHYVKEDMKQRSLRHLDLAIQAIEDLSSDIDLNSKQNMDHAINSLELVYQEILRDSLVHSDMNAAFEYAFNALTLAELRVSERYAESNQPDLALVALKYAQLHLKSALHYGSGSNQLMEQRVYFEIDSMMKSEPMAAVLITEKIDGMIAEMNHLVKR